MQTKNTVKLTGRESTLPSPAPASPASPASYFGSYLYPDKSSIRLFLDRYPSMGTVDDFEIEGDDVLLDPIIDREIYEYLEIQECK